MKYILIAFLICNSLISFSQVEEEHDVQTLIINLSYNVVYLEGESVKQAKLDGINNFDLYFKGGDGLLRPLTETISGTGFFIVHNKVWYLITAQHVAEKLKINPTVTFSDNSNLPFKINLIQLQGSDSLAWIFHPNADVAVLPLFPSSILTNHFKNLLVIPSTLFGDSVLSPKRYSEILAYGFPLRLGIEKHFSPISLSSHVGSGFIDIRRPDNGILSTFFLLDAPSIPGISGGPVFSVPSIFNNGKFRLEGLVHGVITDQTGGKLAAIVPSKFIMETIKMFTGFNGIITIKYPNNNKWSSRKYENGRLLEVFYNYTSDGKEQDKGSLKNGNGTLNYYDLMGKLISIETYKEGKLVEEKKIL